MTKTLLLTTIFCLALVTTPIDAQHRPVRNTVRDYVKLVPRHFSPDDPWTMGKLLRTEVGFGGLFFNCDYEECKRNSPYITWNCQSSDCCRRHLVHDTVHQQLGEVKQRIRWGSCATCATGCRGGCRPGFCVCTTQPKTRWSVFETPGSVEAQALASAYGRTTFQFNLNGASSRSNDASQLVTSLLNEARQSLATVETTVHGPSSIETTQRISSDNGQQLTRTRRRRSFDPYSDGFKVDAGSKRPFKNQYAAETARNSFLSGLLTPKYSSPIAAADNRATHPVAHRMSEQERIWQTISDQREEKEIAPRQARSNNDNRRTDDGNFRMLRR